MKNIKFLIKLSVIVFISAFLGGLNIISTNPFKNLPVIAQNQTNFTTYKDPRGVSISYPKNWLVDVVPPGTEGTDYSITLWSHKSRNGGEGQAPLYMIKTEIYNSSESFNQILRRYSKNNYSQDDGSIITKKGQATLAGRQVYRIWFTGGAFDFPDGIITYVESQNKTFVIISYYTESNINAVPTILNIHGSFRISDQN